MKILTAGGSGFIGRQVCHARLQEGHQVVVPSRTPARAGRCWPHGVHLSEGDEPMSHTLVQALDGMDAVMNLAGEPIAKAWWSEPRKNLLRSSRIKTANLLVETITRLPAPQRPATLINASGVGLYGSHDSGIANEDSPAGQGFLAGLCRDWEQEAIRAEHDGVRVVLLRMGMVLGKDGEL